MPFLDLYLFPFYCYRTDNGYWHKAYPEIECYKDTHVATVILGAICGFFIFLYATIMTLILFRARNDPIDIDANSKFSGRGEFTSLAYKSIVTICFVFLHEETYQFVFLIVITLGSIQLFRIYADNNIHHQFWV